MSNDSIKILLVDDEPDILEILSYNLSAEGYTISTASNGLEAVKKAKKQQPHLIIMDVMMPEMDGIEACEKIRNLPELKDTVITFLTARGEDYSQVAGFEAGADDYITKPFSASVLSARIRAHINRYNRLSNSSGENKGIKRFNGLVIDDESYEVYLHNEKIDLTAKEFQILNLLSSNPNRVYSKEQLFNQIWGYDDFGDTNTVTVHIRKIRMKIEKNSKEPVFIKTIWGVGYKFEN